MNEPGQADWKKMALSMRKAVIAASLGLAGCEDSPAEKAENEYRIAQEAIIDPAGKKCAAANKVAAAYAAEGDAEAYRMWELKAYNDCFEADRY